MKLAELEMLTQAERRQLVEEWNATAREYAQDKCIHQLFEEQVGRTPEAVALIFGQEQLSYRELNSRANRLAHHLRGLGVGPEVIVGVCVERGVEMVVALLGVLKAGGAYLPIDASLPIERISFMLEDAGVAVLLTQEKLAEALPSYWGQTVCLDSEWEQTAASGVENLPGPVTADNLAYVIYTSGSTGRPKGVLVEHRSVSNLAHAQIETFGIHSGSRVLQFASISFDASVWEIFSTLFAGATLCLGTKEDMLPGPRLVELLGEQAITIVTLPPSVLSLMPAQGWPAPETIIVAGERCPPELATRWSEGCNFYNAYGPTEVTVCATLTRCQGRYLNSPPIGRPLPNTQVYILDGHMRVAPIGVTGELYVGGAGVARGYLNRPELTLEKFVPDHLGPRPGARLYKTGDMARWLGDGNVEYVGRVDTQVKVRGYRIELGEIEATLSRHEGVRDCVVVAREDEELSGQLIAYVVAEGGGGPDANELREFMGRQVPEYMVPSVIMFLDQLPLTPNGKVDRRALPAPDPAKAAAAITYVAPRTELERTIIAVWQTVLEREDIGVNDNFFDLGGHSLLVAKVHARLSDELGMEIQTIKLFEHPTVSSLAAYLSGETQEETPAEVEPERAELRKESLRQRRMARSGHRASGETGEVGDD